MFGLLQLISSPNTRDRVNDNVWLTRWRFESDVAVDGLIRKSVVKHLRALSDRAAAHIAAHSDWQGGMLDEWWQERWTSEWKKHWNPQRRHFDQLLREEFGVYVFSRLSHSTYTSTQLRFLKMTVNLAFFFAFDFFFLCLCALLSWIQFPTMNSSKRQMAL